MFAMQILDFFQRLYVINLPERRDRRQATERELHRIGLDLQSKQIEIFPGIRPSSPSGFPSIGARGCFLSHLEVLKQAQAQNLANVLILEDDILFSNTFPRYEARLMQQLSQWQAWGFAYFGYPTVFDENEPPGTFVPFTQPLTTTVAYGINRSLFQRLIIFLEALQHRTAGHPLGGPMHLDGAYNTFRQQNPDVVALRTAPAFIGQRSSRSDIFPNAWYDCWPMAQQLVELARAGKNYYRSRTSKLV